MTDIRKTRVLGLVGVDPSRQANMGLLERVASGINNLYSDPRRARGMTNMGMALMDAAGPQMPGQQMSTGQMLARGLAGFQQGATAYDAEQMALRQQALQEQEAMMRQAALAQEMAAASAPADPFLAAFGDSLEGRQLANLAQQYQRDYNTDAATAIDAVVRWEQSQPTTVTTSDAVYTVPRALPGGLGSPGPAPSTPSGTAQPPQGGGQPTRILDRQRDVPQGVIDQLSDAMSQLNRIREARSLLSQYGDSLGAQNMLPLSDTFYQFAQPDATALRGAIAAIENMQIKDVSGATVTAAEDKRLAPYIPKLTDRPAVVAEKLAMFERQLGEIINGYTEYYSEAQGFRPIPESLRYSGGQAESESQPRRYDPITGGFTQ